MFESVHQDGRLGGVVYVTSVLVSVAAHAAILCVLAVLPLIFFNVLQSQELLTFLIEPPPPVQPPPPVLPARVLSAHRVIAPPIGYVSPVRMPKGIPPADDADPVRLLPAWTIPGVASPGGRSGEHGGSIPGLLADEPVRLDPPPPPKAPQEPIRVGMLETSKLIYKVNPVYPALAAKARISGTVVLEAMVDEEGNVSRIQVLSGHAFLVDAAVQAVRQWKYSPTVLNGEPVQVLATVTVIFRLN